MAIQRWDPLRDLIELQERDRLIRPGMTVIDLGSAPGGWSQVAAEQVGRRGRVIASDILPMDSIAGVVFVQGDFTEEEILRRILDAGRFYNNVGNLFLHHAPELIDRPTLKMNPVEQTQIKHLEMVG